MPQLPTTTVVTPWLIFGSMSGPSITARSSWVCTSMKPGATTRPATSMLSFARSAAMLPVGATAAMRSPRMATSAWMRGAPEPSITVPLRSRRS